MQKIVFTLAVLLVASGIGFGQRSPLLDVEPVTFELTAPWDFTGGKPKPSAELRATSCLSLISLRFECRSDSHIAYGSRLGDNWDIFDVQGARDAQTRMVDLGVRFWSDLRTVPEIQPWAKLEPGQERHMSFNTSGGGRGTENLANAPVSRQVKTAVASEAAVRLSDYAPLTQIHKGHIYAIRVVDTNHDFYVLVRVDDLERGTKATISVKTLQPRVIAL